ncbi:MAG: insulinase family protein, partial [Leptospiraceae bacterium]|nr:insulinase family protein [Leptospiraceae bacterium]
THFLEHMLFKGTKKRTAKEQAEEIERVGGYINAVTSREYTYFYVTLIKDRLELGLDILSDMVFQPLLREADIQNESAVIIEEMRGYEDSPDDFVYDFYFRNIFSGDSLGRDILGTRESISSVTEKSLKAFYKKHYTTDRMILSISSSHSEKEIINLAEKYFTEMRQVRSKKKNLPVGVDKSFSTNFTRRKLEQVNFLLGADGFARNLSSIIHLILFATIMGGGMSSRLFQKIREEKGLCYSINCFPSSYSRTGIVSVSCGTSKEKFEYCLESIMNELRLVKAEGFSKSELEDAKSNQIGAMSIGFEAPDQRMTNIALQEIYYNRYFSLKERTDAIKKVKIDDLQETIEKIFSIERLHFSGIGDLSKSTINRIDTSI